MKIAVETISNVMITSQYTRWSTFIKFLSTYGIQIRFWWRAALLRNLVPKPQVSFGQHQNTELWNNQFPESKSLGVLVSLRMRAWFTWRPGIKSMRIRTTKAFNTHWKN